MTKQAPRLRGLFYFVSFTHWPSKHDRHLRPDMSAQPTCGAIMAAERLDVAVERLPGMNAQDPPSDG